MRVASEQAVISMAVWLVVINGVVFGLDSLGWLRLVRIPLEPVSVPVQSGLAKLGQGLKGEFSRPFKARSRLINQETLQVELDSLKAENARLRLNLSELEAQLRLEKILPQATIIQAGVVEVGEKLVVDKGARDGIKEGAVVVVGDLLVGKVSSLTPQTALVSLVTDPDLKLPALVIPGSGGLGAETGRGLAVGRFHQEVELNQVLASERLEKGQLVITAGGGGVPRSLVIGEIIEVQGAEADLFSGARVATLIDYKRLASVSIILNW